MDNSDVASFAAAGSKHKMAHLFFLFIHFVILQHYNNAINPSACPDFCHVQKPLTCKQQAEPTERIPFSRDPRCNQVFSDVSADMDSIVEVPKNCYCKEGFIRDDEDLQDVLDKNFGTGMCLKLDACKQGCTVTDGEIIGVCIIIRW